MARTVLAVQQIVRAGLTPAFTAANVDGHSIVNNGHTFIEVKNVNAATRTVTVQTPRLVDGIAVAELEVVIPITTGDKMIGPFPAETFNQAGGVIYVDFSAVADLTIAAIKLE